MITMISSRKQPLSPSEFQTIYSRVPRMTVEIVIKTAAGVVLALRHEKSWQGKWHLPGGTVLYQERIEEALKRIANEELGVEIRVGKLLGYIEYPSEEKERGFGWSVGMAFLCELASAPNAEHWQQQGIQFFGAIPENIVEEQTFIIEQALQEDS
jgi:ADP-ribose pyrophosphatase YjhB (NUDIX family)